jgi:hypothetical protein
MHITAWQWSTIFADRTFASAWESRASSVGPTSRPAVVTSTDHEKSPYCVRIRTDGRAFFDTNHDFSPEKPISRARRAVARAFSRLPGIFSKVPNTRCAEAAGSRPFFGAIWNRWMPFAVTQRKAAGAFNPWAAFNINRGERKS